MNYLNANANIDKRNWSIFQFLHFCACVCTKHGCTRTTQTQSEKFLPAIFRSRLLKWACESHCATSEHLLCVYRCLHLSFVYHAPFTSWAMGGLQRTHKCTDSGCHWRPCMLTSELTVNMILNNIYQGP